MSAKKYELRTIKDIFDQVPADRIKDCCIELGQVMAQARYLLQLVEAAAEAPGEPLKADEIFQFPETVTWTDDGKGEIATRMVDSEGEQLLSIIARPEGAA